MSDWNDGRAAPSTGTGEERRIRVGLIVGALAVAADVTGDNRAVDRIYPYYRAMTRHTSQPLRFYGSDWVWWQAYMANLNRRFGPRAVTSPQSFDIPKAR